MGDCQLVLDVPQLAGNEKLTLMPLPASDRRPQRFRLPQAGADRFAIAAMLAWLAWLAVSAVASWRGLSPLIPYLTAPLVAGVGVVLGRLAAGRWRRWWIPPLLGVLGLVLLVVPMYANAQAAVGVQLVALASLVLLTARPEPLAPDDPALGVPDTFLLAFTAVIVVAGVLLAARSDAASILVVPLAVLTTTAIARRSGPPRWVTVSLGVNALALAFAVVGWLGTLITWPAWLNRGSSLSSARHLLWRDALSLWRKNPITGGGPGSFIESSAIAGSRAGLETVHSSALQVGAELGIVGLVLFVGLLAAGLALAARGTRPAALIAVAAWSCLGVHSMIDHLYEYPPVTLAAGLVLGWASSTDPGADRPSRA